jgi:hypothetical protein
LKGSLVVKSGDQATQTRDHVYNARRFLLLAARVERGAADAAFAARNDGNEFDHAIVLQDMARYCGSAEAYRESARLLKRIFT